MQLCWPETGQPLTIRGTEIRPDDPPEIYLQKLARVMLDEMSPQAGILTTAGIVIDCNRAALEGGGLSRAETIGKPFWQALWWTAAPERESDLREAAQRAARGESIRLEVEVNAKSGTGTRAIELTLRPVRDVEGSVVFLLLEGRDVTGAARTNNGQPRIPLDAAPVSALLSAIVDSSDDAIISKDLNGIIMSWNKGAERLFGYTAAEAVGRSILMLIPPDRQDEEPQILDRLKRGERVDHFETIRVRKDGSRLNISLTISPVKDANGRIVGASKIARDITERVRQDIALKEANDALQQANADLQQFAYSASHDLQEPLRMVTAYSELLEKRFGGQLGSVGDEYIRHTVRGALRMDRLLRDLRTYMQVTTAERGATEEVDAGAVLDKALANLEAAINESGASIRRTALPRVFIHEFELAQVFQNLIGNAIRYRGDAQPEIAVSARRQGEEWLFSVSDNGIGIERQFQELIFGMFKRLHNSAENTGTGMGLAICRRIIERGGGRIWVESEPGKGSTFYFTIPAL